MVDRKRCKCIENPEGVGEVWEKDKKVAKVTYNLDVQQEILITESFNKTSELEGMKYISGSITILEGEKHLIGRDKLTLNMQDGRKIDFFITHFNPMVDNIQIQPTGSFY
jgi:hypothetical protein